MTAQGSLPFDQCSEVDPSVFRTVHYLGSKLRFVDFIRSVVDDVDPGKGGVCDLFAGSGAVTQALSRDRKVVSVDIQEYSRVICSALLTPTSNGFGSDFARGISSSYLYDSFYKKVFPLIELEERAISGDLSSDAEFLCSFLESSSIYSITNYKGVVEDGRLSKALADVANGIERLGSKSLLVTKYFGGIYFSFRQAVELDVILESIHKANEDCRDILLASALSTASDIANTVGKQFAQPLRPRDKEGRPKKSLLEKVRKDRSVAVFPRYKSWVRKYAENRVGNFKHKVLCTDFRDALSNLDEDVKVVYADPPYTRDHYSRFYHALETMAKMDFPVVSTTNIGGKTKLSRGLYRDDRHQSDFCIKSKAPGAFEDLFRAVSDKGLVLLLSYSPYDTEKGAHPRVVDLEFIMDMASKYFSKVDIRSPGRFSHSKLNRTDLHLEASETAEVLIVCR